MNFVNFFYLRNQSGYCFGSCPQYSMSYFIPITDKGRRFAQAKQIYFEMLFAKASDTKMGAAYVMDYLACSICFLHGSYFKKAQIEQVAALLSMGAVPEGFAELYMLLFVKKARLNKKRLCYELICLVERFLERPQTAKPQEHNFQDLSDWYAELTYTLLRICHFGKTEDMVKTYMWAAMMQEELNRVCEEFLREV